MTETIPILFIILFIFDGCLFFISDGCLFFIFDGSLSFIKGVDSSLD